MESKNEYEAFVERIRQNVKKAENIRLYKDGSISVWIGNLFIVLEPQLDSVGLVATSIEATWYNSQLKPIIRLYFSPDEIMIEDNDRKLECEFKYIEQDPTVLADEQELFEYLNEIAKINDYEEFKQFAEKEFKDFAGLS